MRKKTNKRRISKAERFAKSMEKFGSVFHRKGAERMYPDMWRGYGEVVAFRLTEDRPGTFWALFEEGTLTSTWPPGRLALAELDGLSRDAFERRVWRTRTLWHSPKDADEQGRRFHDLVRAED